MKRFEVYSGYQQFYVADIGVKPSAPVDWTNENIAQRHNTLKSITALRPVGDITAKIISCGPGESALEEVDKPDFEVTTQIDVLSGKIGVLGWPYELQDQYLVSPGIYAILFKGYRINKAEEKNDYYVVRIEQIENQNVAISR